MTVVLCPFILAPIGRLCRGRTSQYFKLQCILFPHIDVLLDALPTIQLMCKCVCVVDRTTEVCLPITSYVNNVLFVVVFVRKNLGHHVLVEYCHQLYTKKVRRPSFSVCRWL